jgi:hypothetical protein
VHSRAVPASAPTARRDAAVTLADVVGHPASLAVILAFGLGLRAHAVWHAHFDRDQAEFWERALAVAAGRDLPLLGAAVSGTEARVPGSAYYYVIALPQLLTTHPLAGSAFTALLNLLAVWLLYRAAVLAWGLVHGACVLLLSIASPWVVAHGDRIWSANLLLPVSALALWSLAAVLHRPRTRAAAALALTFVVGPQMHPSALWLWAVVAVPLLVRRPEVAWRWALAGAALGLATYVPYLWHEIQTGFANTALLASQPSSARAPRLLLGLVLHFLSFATTDAAYLVVQGYWRGFEHVPFWTGDGPSRIARFYASLGVPALLWTSHGAGWTLMAVALMRAARAWARARDRRGWLFDDLGRLLFASGVATLVVLYFVTGKAGYVHYLVPLLPLSFIPAVSLLVRLLRERRTAPLAVVYLFLAPVAGALVLAGFYRTDGRLSVGQQEAVIRYILARTEGSRPFELHFSFPEGRGMTYGVLARAHLGLRWPVTERAHDVFTVTPAEDPPPPPTRGRVADVQTLGRLRVIHVRW